MTPQLCYRTSNTLKNHLSNPKDKVEMKQKSELPKFHGRFLIKFILDKQNYTVAIH